MSTTTAEEKASPEETVTAILTAAGLTVSAEEKATMVRDFPLVRAGADRMYLPELEHHEPAIRFDPTDFYPTR
ncbi:hypothetical protein DT076_18230 [Desertihabitans brevis]|uniref:Uncharacterized protein n=1 Tax=Desertihabitans brevis TaxID=2268447 RepID=A0A367YQ26_9ACTN|nr:hypothetical protein [Desertihabitans brevis]RCK67996.1 hypothetical protein DT076_18230 [Desertihabitans brevis]